MVALREQVADLRRSGMLVPLRRKFATELKDTPLIDLCRLGGWKRPMTPLMCYQKPDEETMRKALKRRRVVRAATG